MAKSLRSKRARKMRAIKRVRYGVKELARLQKMLKNAGENPETSDTSTGFQLVSPPSASVAEGKPEDMLVETPPTQVVDPKTMRDQLGNYPVWFNQKQIKRIRRARKQRGKKQKNRRGSSREVHKNERFTISDANAESTVAAGKTASQKRELH